MTIHSRQKRRSEYAAKQEIIFNCPDPVFFDRRGFRARANDKQQVVGLIESGTLAFTAYDRQVEYIRIYGDTAIVAGGEIVVWAGKMPNAGKTSHLRFTAVWMKQDGRWQEVARHANIIDQH